MTGGLRSQDSKPRGWSSINVRVFNGSRWRIQRASHDGNFRRYWLGTR